jgi:hypothetical protein
MSHGRRCGAAVNSTGAPLSAMAGSCREGRGQGCPETAARPGTWERVPGSLHEAYAIRLWAHDVPWAVVVRRGEGQCARCAGSSAEATRGS